MALVARERMLALWLTIAVPQTEFPQELGQARSAAKELLAER
jgi:hypothetical protein